MSVVYEAVPEGFDFNSVFDTYILGYCPDTLSWFATNQRFFYFEYPKEFKDKEEAEDYFRRNKYEFYNLQLDLTEYIPDFAKNTLFLDINKNLTEKILV